MKYSKYPNYKDSGVEWLEMLPNTWEARRLGFYFSERREKVSDKDYPALSVTKNGIVPQLDNAAKTDDGDNRKKVCAGDFVINSRSDRKGSSGLSELTGSVSLINTIITPKTINGQYTHHLLRSYPFQEEFYRYGKGIVADLWSTNYTSMKNILIPYPPLQEQQAIANYLDKATAKIDTLIEKQTRLIELLKEKRQAVISTAVTRGLDSTVAMKDSGVEWLGEIPEGWNSYRIDWISTIVRGNTGFKKDELLSNGEYVALQYGKTYKVDEVNEAFSFYVNSEFYKLNQVAHMGDTILISTSETVEDLGHSCFYNREDLGLIGGEQILLKPDTKFMFEKFLYYSSKMFSNELKKYSTGLKVFRFSIDDLKNIFISIPSITEQQTIVNYIDEKTSKIDTLITKSTKAIDLLKEKRTALISAAVTGKIDVRDVS